MDKNLYILTRDISQTYVQSDIVVQQPVFVIPSYKHHLGSSTVVRFERPLYSLPEAGLRWFRSYHVHRRKVLVLHLSTINPCFFYTPERFFANVHLATVPRGFACPKTDDTENASNNIFAEKEMHALQKFDYKALLILSDDNPVTFSGAKITHRKRFYYIAQPMHIAKLSDIETIRVEKMKYITEHTRGAHTAAISRPDLASGFSV